MYLCINVIFRRPGRFDERTVAIYPYCKCAVVFAWSVFICACIDPQCYLICHALLIHCYSHRVSPPLPQCCGSTLTGHLLCGKTAGFSFAPPYFSLLLQFSLKSVACDIPTSATLMFIFPPW